MQITLIQVYTNEHHSLIQLIPHYITYYAKEKEDEMPLLVHNNELIYSSEVSTNQPN